MAISQLRVITVVTRLVKAKLQYVIAATQCCRLFGTAETCERIGRDAGRLFSPAVVSPEDLFVSRKSNLAKPECFLSIAAGQ
jgi:hypothetical protein